MSDVVPKETLGARLRATVSIFLPQRLQELFSRGLLFMALAVLAAVLAGPLLVAFLAAYWLSWAEASNVEVLQSLRRSYVAQIRRGFGVDEKLAADSLELNKRLAADSLELNKRLDYLLPLDFVLGPESSKAQPFWVNLEVKRGQRLVLTLTYIVLEHDNACRLDSSVTENLLEVKIGKQDFIDCNQLVSARRAGGCSKALDERNWTTFKGEFFENANDPNDPDVAATMTFRRSEGLKQSCSPLHIRGDIAIFKDVYNMASP